MYKLLIVDDNNVQINYLTSCIDYNKLNISEVITACDGMEGYNIYKNIHPDIVITDVEMPVMDGVEMMKKIIEDGGKCKFLFISCYDDFEYIKEAMDNNAVSYLLKPVEPEELIKNLTKVIEEIEKETNFTEFNRIFGESLEIFRENFLYRFLHSTHIDETNLKNTFDNLKFNKYNEFFVAALEVKEKVDMYNFLNTIKVTLLTKVCGIAVLESDNRCVIVFMADNEENFYERIKELMTHFCEKMLNEKGLNISVGMSSSKSTLYDAKLMFNQAINTLDEKITTTDTGIYDYSDDVMAGDGDYEIAELRDSVLYMYESTEADPVNEFLEKYYVSSMSVDYAKKLSISIITTLQIILMERGININDIFGSSAVVWDKIDRFETIPDNRRWLYNILKTTLEFIDDDENRRYRKIVHDIEENINQNYAVVSNVSDVIGNLYISTSYAQSIFKKYTGKTISDYVTERRMEAAKELLKDPYIKVYEVSEKVGYKSKAHFSESFKKYTGMTPKEFRMTH